MEIIFRILCISKNTDQFLHTASCLSCALYPDISASMCRRDTVVCLCIRSQTVYFCWYSILKCICSNCKRGCMKAVPELLHGSIQVVFDRQGSLSDTLYL